MKLNNSFGKLASLILTALLLVFAYNYIARIIDEADFSGISINWFILLIAITAFVGFYGILAVHWLWACRIVKASVKDDQKLAFLASQPYKYLPTSLFTFSFRGIYARKLDLGLKSSSAAQLLENISLLLSNLVVFLVFYLGNSSLVWGFTSFFILILAVMLLARNKLRTIKFRSMEIKISQILLVRLFLLASAAWVVAGLSFVLLNLAMDFPIGFLNFIAANTIAFSLSILAFFAPGGIGVRELVYSNFSINASAIIIWRIFTFAADMILGFAAVVFINRIKKHDQILKS